MITQFYAGSWNGAGTDVTVVARRPFLSILETSAKMEEKIGEISSFDKREGEKKREEKEKRLANHFTPKKAFLCDVTVVCTGLTPERKCASAMSYYMSRKSEIS